MGASGIGLAAAVCLPASPWTSRSSETSGSSDRTGAAWWPTWGAERERVLVLIPGYARAPVFAYGHR